MARRTIARIALLLAAALVTAATFAARAASAADAVVAVHVQVSTAPAVPSFARDAVEEALAVAVARSGCAVRLSAPEAPAEFVLAVTVLRWQEREAPGGAAVFDPATGGYVVATMHMVESRQRTTILRPPDPEPLASRERNASSQAGGRRDQSSDPAGDARRRIVAEIAQDASRSLCKVVRKQRRA